MNDIQKHQIKDALKRWNEWIITHNATETTAIAPPVANAIENDNWSLLNDDQWLEVASKVGFYSGERKVGETSVYLLLHVIFRDALNHRYMYCAGFAKGIGKTTAAIAFLKQNERTALVHCNENLTKNGLFACIESALKVSFRGRVVRKTQQLLHMLANNEGTLFIFDNCDRLPASTFDYLCELALEIQPYAGIVFMGQETIKQHFDCFNHPTNEAREKIAGIIGDHFATMRKPGPHDIACICNAYGIYDEHTIRFIQQSCGNSLHGINDYMYNALLDKKAA